MRAAISIGLVAAVVQARLATRVSSSSGVLRTWNTDMHPATEVATWQNGNCLGTKITNTRMLNAHTEALLAVASSDGIVRLWSKLGNKQPEYLTGWRAVSKLREARDGNVGAGLIIEWNQSVGYMLASGDVQYIQLWDANAQARFQKIPTNVPSCVTNMQICDDNSSLVVAGFGNGNVCLFDLRQPNDKAVVQRFEQHKSWVVAANLQRGHQHVISGSKAGDILWWDTRFPGQAVRNLRAYKLKRDDTMTSMVMHPYGSMLATATPNQFIKIFNLEGELLNHHKHYTNFLGEAIGPISCLAFHPFKPHLAAGSYERIISIYGPGR